MTYETLLVDVDPRGVATVTLNRPEKRNALSAQMMDDLTHVATTLGAAEETRAMVLTGAGSAFCGGGDLNWMKEQINADTTTRAKEAGRIARMLKALNETPTPLIGRIQGDAMGGGVGLACICDVAIAADHARFGLTETRLGLIPATIGPYVIARMGEGKARRIFMSSRVFGAAEAEKLDIIASHVAVDELDTVIAAEVAPYLTVAPRAVGTAKALARSLGMTIDQATIDATVDRLTSTWEGDEALHGLNAFLTKTKPRWAKTD